MDENEPTKWPDLIGGLVKRLTQRGTSGLGAVVQVGKQRMDRRQSQRELEHFWIRLGKTAYHLTEAGELDHPAVRKAMGRIDSLQNQLANTTNHPENGH